ncbi:MAG: hypothetical protein Kow00109_17420 [Acidobacteriota bacterium]
MIRFSPVRIWGSSRGLSTLSPSARLLGGCCLVGALAAADYSSPHRVCWWLATILLWTLGARPRPGPVAGATVAAALLSAGFAGSLWVASLAGGSESAELHIRSLDLVLRGVGTAHLSVSLLGAFQPGELEQGLRGIGVPAAAAEWLLSLFGQAGALWEETVRLAAALRLRLPTSSRDRRRLVAALPQVWLLRLANKAERVHLAMLARGRPEAPPSSGGSAWRAKEIGWLALVLAWSSLPWWERYRW